METKPTTTFLAVRRRRRTSECKKFEDPKKKSNEEIAKTGMKSNRKSEQSPKRGEFPVCDFMQKIKNTNEQNLHKLLSHFHS